MLMEADELAVHIVAVCDPALVSVHTIDLTKVCFEDVTLHEIRTTGVDPACDVQCIDI